MKGSGCIVIGRPLRDGNYVYNQADDLSPHVGGLYTMANNCADRLLPTRVQRRSLRRVITELHDPKYNTASIIYAP